MISIGKVTAAFYMTVCSPKACSYHRVACYRGGIVAGNYRWVMWCRFAAQWVAMFDKYAAGVTLVTACATVIRVELNPLKPSVTTGLHFEVFRVPYRPNLPFLISDIRAPWRSGLSARVPECQNF